MTKPFRYTITPRGEVRLEMNDTTFFLNRRRAAELLRTIGDAVREQGADNGPTAPEPRIIRTLEELAALDPDTMLGVWHPDLDMGCILMPAREWADDPSVTPLSVIATGEQVRAARQALKEGA